MIAKVSFFAWFGRLYLCNGMSDFRAVKTIVGRGCPPDRAFHTPLRLCVFLWMTDTLLNTDTHNVTFNRDTQNLTGILCNTWVRSFVFRKCRQGVVGVLRTTRDVYISLNTILLAKHNLYTCKMLLIQFNILEFWNVAGSSRCRQYLSSGGHWAVLLLAKKETAEHQPLLRHFSTFLWTWAFRKDMFLIATQS